MTDTETMEMRWEWFDRSDENGPTWKVYDHDIQTTLNDSVKNNKKSVKFKTGEAGEYEAIFGMKMVQKNLKSGYERPIRLCIKHTSDSQNNHDEDDDDDKTKKDKKIDWFYWQWLNDNNKWITYTPDVTIQLEQNYQQYINSNKTTNKTFKLDIAETKSSYLIDFYKMAQINSKSSFVRDVKRVASDITNMNAGDGPSSNLRKRKTITGDDKKLSDVSVKSEKTDILEDEEEKPTKEASSSDENSPKPKRKSKPAPKKSGSTASNSEKRKKAKSDSESEEDEQSSAKSGAKSSKKKPKKAVKQEIKEEQEEIIKTVKFSGEVPLDEKFIETVGADYKIYKEGEVIFDCMLNQTNLQYNNNKYYLIQLIENKKSKNYLVWMRWGRVGKTGQFSVEHCGSDLNKAKNIFTKKFLDKTHNEWESKELFEKVPGKYDLVLKDYDSTDSNSGDADVKTVLKGEQIDAEPAVKVESKLDKKLQHLIELICNVTEMENMLKEMKYDAKKAPLGKLGKSQIKAGYAALKEIEDLLKRKATGRELVQANNDFYTRIPHDFGMRTPPMINTQAQVREKLKLLELLDDIEVAIKALNQKSEIDNPIDRHYEQLECALKPLDHDDQMFKIIAEYVKLTHAPTHNNYKLKLVDVFEAQRKDEHARFTDHGNRMLLWHGSRITNWAGILSQGLRIAPEEAPVTGYMFGKGVYFSDCCSKSANYCYTSSNKNIGLLSLSEVSLGVPNELKQADYNADKLPKGTHSTKGVGRSEPDKSQWKTLDDGCVVPCGKIKSTVKPSEASSYALLYNEYIVYNVDQIKLRYIVKVEFDYDDE